MLATTDISFTLFKFSKRDKPNIAGNDVITRILYSGGAGLKTSLIKFHRYGFKRAGYFLAAHLL